MSKKLASFALFLTLFCAAAHADTEVVCDVQENGAQTENIAAADGSVINSRIAALQAQKKTVTISQLTSSTGGAALPSGPTNTNSMLIVIDKVCAVLTY